MDGHGHCSRAPEPRGIHQETFSRELQCWAQRLQAVSRCLRRAGRSSSKEGVGVKNPDVPCLSYMLTLTPQTTPTDRHIWQSHGVFGKD